MQLFKHNLMTNASTAYNEPKPRLVAGTSGRNDNSAMHNKIGPVILRRLKELGKTRAWLAEKAQVSTTTVHYWINKGEITLDNAMVLADLLSVSMDELLGRESQNQGEGPMAPKMQLAWVSDVELDLLTRFRNTDEMGRKLICMALNGAPQIQAPSGNLEH